MLFSMAKKKFTKKIKKNAKRNKTPYANLKKKYHNLNIQEWIDYTEEYVKSLPPEDRAYLDKFMEEEYRAYFNKDKKKHINKKANRKAIYSNNNARNRDVYARAKGEKKLVYSTAKSLSEAVDKYNNLTNPEDALIEMIDMKRAMELKED